MGLTDFSFSMQMRDTIARIAEETVNRIRPRYRYGIVDSIDRPNRKCGVVYTGDAAAVIVSMGAIQPSVEGQIVRIEGIGTDKFITDVLGVPYFDPANVTDNLPDYPKILAGVVSITPSAADTPTFVHVDFPAGFFTAVPVISVSLHSGVPYTTARAVSYNNPATTGVDVGVVRSNTTATNVSWTAIQLP